MPITGKFTPDAKDVAFEHQSVNGYFHRQRIVTPIIAVATRLKTANASSNTLATTITSFSAQPDVARNITVTPGGTTNSVKADSIVVTGTNIRGDVITESILMTENGTDLVSGVKAFKTVTSIVIPAQDGAGATFSFGVGDVLGLDRCLQGDEVIFVTLDGVYETSRPTVVTDTDEVEKNTVDISGSLNGSKDVVIGMSTKEII